MTHASGGRKRVIADLARDIMLLMRDRNVFASEGIRAMHRVNEQLTDKLLDKLYPDDPNRRGK
jgi:hypothetical protein